jgi:LysM domain
MNGFMVRDSMSRLQGFIHYTTFTNWQESFRWDSIHDSCFSYDEKAVTKKMIKGERIYDKDGSLAASLQQTVRFGDPWNEGIVWPKIAEISLLGGLGCGKALLSLVIEKLETMKPDANHNYEYVALQATKNSIPFYEAMGFIRVGALTIDTDFKETRTFGGSRVSETSMPPSESLVSDFISSPIMSYTVVKPGESPNEISKKFSVSAWDIVFLNRHVYTDLTTKSRLKKGTKLNIPSIEATKADATSLVQSVQDLQGDSTAPRWYRCKENDTPKMIANRFNLNCKALVQANIQRLSDLTMSSRLKEGTLIRVSHFHMHEDEHVPYCHWTFPDDKFENVEPSYMMVRKLNHRSGSDFNKGSNEKVSKTIAISPYVSPPKDLFHVVTKTNGIPNAEHCAAKIIATSSIELPGKPKRPLSPFEIFCDENREFSITQPCFTTGDRTQNEMELWNQLDATQRNIYQEIYDLSMKSFHQSLLQYQSKLKQFFQKHPEMKPLRNENANVSAGENNSLFNKVVMVKSLTPEHPHWEYTYYYVLTFIPDLFWCHLAPMRQVGIWGSDKPMCEGRPIWMLVDESENMEIDISAYFCEIVKSRSMRHTVDADKEQWDIPSSTVISPCPSLLTKLTSGARLGKVRKKDLTQLSSSSKIKKRKTQIHDYQGKAQKSPTVQSVISMAPILGSIRKSFPIAYDSIKSSSMHSSVHERNVDTSAVSFVPDEEKIIPMEGALKTLNTKIAPCNGQNFENEDEVSELSASCTIDASHSTTTHTPSSENKKDYVDLFSTSRFSSIKNQNVPSIGLESEERRRIVCLLK